MHYCFYPNYYIVHSFVEIARYPLQLEGVHYLLSDQYNQDPLEAFFGKQRGYGGRCENPTVKQFIKNSVLIRVQKSATLSPIRSNCRRKRPTEITVDNTPYPKRARSGTTDRRSIIYDGTKN
jgi:hypothetical protein